ncbi:hypothetical protein FNQ90_19060 [Streptomyces alkaliphilus]|uniref:Uncharacterized protein n=1 Tax=Streptomyces alkaliphilus TaxID=1472722 RepID=A0A7W3Y318_9ACTN|nr:DUF6584 family protein [Streptomyces alkaliphilus]MBB0246148.1 hypothetical protein [Streptomyces alkaliphilus]
MGIERTLERVETDLAAGRVPVARQRLRGLAGSFPQNLGIRARLAEVYRLYGEPAQAGRWSLLEADRRPEEVAAFEARHPDPVERMRLVAWRGPEEEAATAFARERLAELRREASRAAGRPLEWGSTDPPTEGEEESGDIGDTLAGWGCFAATLLFLLLAGIGAVTVLRWLW